MNRPKRVAAIHDLSVFGRCSLSVIAPIISALGVQLLPIPTVLMSTHTGGFSNIQFSNCNDFVARTADHLKECNAEIDCIYSGYIADKTAFDGVYVFFENFPNAKRIIDPVLGDHGRLYSALSEEIIEYMRTLIKHADIITPNITEVCLLLNCPFQDTYSKASIKELIIKLSEITTADTVITGVTVDSIGKCNVIKSKESVLLVPCFYKHQSYEGTGDAFASVVTGCVISEKDLAYSVICASKFIEKCIDLTYDSGEPIRDGIFIEPALPFLFDNETQDREIITL